MSAGDDLPPGFTWTVLPYGASMLALVVERDGKPLLREYVKTDRELRRETKQMARMAWNIHRLTGGDS